jgi:WD40 repeat protein
MTMTAVNVESDPGPLWRWNASGIALKFVASLLLISGLIGAHARAEDIARGEIRLLAPLSSVPSSVAVAPDGSYVLVSTGEGSVSVFDLNTRYGQQEVLISSPIRDEEFEKQRPLALSPSGDLIALGAPLERDKPNTARIYFLKRTDSKRILFTIDGLASRPMSLKFVRDRDGKRLLLAGAFAKEQPPRIWDVTKIADAARDSAIKPEVKGIVLDEPVDGFLGACERSECHSWSVSFPPNADSPIGLALGADSGLVLYDRSLQVAAYGFWKDGRPDLRRISSINFAPDGSRFAVGRYVLEPLENPDNSACQVDIYDVSAAMAVDADRKFKAQPKSLKIVREKNDPCNLSHIVWTKDAIFAQGHYISQFTNGECKTFRNLDLSYDFGANTMVRWKSPEDPSPELICVGTNILMDALPLPAGGIVLATQDPALSVYDTSGRLAHFRAQPKSELEFDGSVMDFRDTARGHLSVNHDGSVVYLRPLALPATYVAFDVTPPPLVNPLVIGISDVAEAEGKDGDTIADGTRKMRLQLDSAKAKMLELLKDNRKSPAEIEFPPAKPGPEDCLNGGFKAPVRLLDLTKTLKAPLKLRPPENIRSFEFLPPENPNDGWRVLLGTSHRLIYASCDGSDFWHEGKAIASIDFPGAAVRNDAYQVRVSGDRRFAIAAHADGILRWYRMSSGQHVLSAFVHPNLRSWIVWSVEGYFDRSDDVGGQVGGWLQTKPLGNGTWSLNLQPLAKYEDEWRKPDKLRSVLASDNDSKPISVLAEAPDSKKSKLSLRIVGGENLSSPLVKVQVRISDFSGPLAPLPISVGTSGMGTVKLDGVQPRYDGSDFLMDGSFTIDNCLQTEQRILRIWTQFTDQKLNNSTDEKTATYKGPPGTPCNKPKVWGIVVGISAYVAGNKPLRYADQDARRFFDYWKGQDFYDVGRLTLVTAPVDEVATATLIDGGKVSTNPLPAKAEAIRKLLATELGKIRDAGIKPTDILLIYFAGHGFSDRNKDVEHWYFMPSDADTTKPDTTAIDAVYIKDALQFYDKSIPILVFLDACRNFATSYGGKPYAGTAILDFKALIEPLNTTVFLATGSGEAAYELSEHDLTSPSDPKNCIATNTTEKEGGGAFTHVLLGILNRKFGTNSADGRIPMYEIDRYLNENVAKICAKQVVRIVPTLQAAPLLGLFYK